MSVSAGEERRRFGIIAADPLRTLGLASLFPEEIWVELRPLDLSARESWKDLSLMMVDATCTELPFELISHLRRLEPGLRIVVLGLEREFDYIERVIEAGAKGYLLHGISEAEIRTAVEIVLDGSIWAPRKVLARLLEKGAAERRRARTDAHPTQRELDVLRLLVQGAPNREIGSALGIDEATVKAHVGRLMRKVGVRNRTALGVEATRRRMLDIAGEEDV